MTSPEDQAARDARLEDAAVASYTQAAGDPEEHPGNPHVRAYLLAGGKLGHLAIDVNMGVETLRRLAEDEGPYMPDDKVVTRLWLRATGQVRDAEALLRRELLADPIRAVNNPELQARGRDLDRAHELVHGHSLLDKIEARLRAAGAL